MLYGEVTPGLFLHTTFSADIYFLKIIFLIVFKDRVLPQADFELSVSVSSFGSAGIQVCDTRPTLFKESYEC